MGTSNIFDDIDISDILDESMSSKDDSEKETDSSSDSDDESLDSLNFNEEGSQDGNYIDTQEENLLKKMDDDSFNSIMEEVEGMHTEHKKQAFEKGDIDSLSMDDIVNSSVEDTIKMATSEVTFDKSVIANLTEEQLLKIDKNDKIFNYLTPDQKEFILDEEAKAFTMKSFGQDIIAYMNKKGVIEISLEQDGFIWVEEFGQPERINTGIKLSNTDSTKIIKLVSRFNGHTITRENPKIDGVTPNGMRFSALMYDCVQYRNTFSIRKPSGVVIPLSQYVDRKIMTAKQVDFIAKQIMDKKNILFSGGTSSGKTTSINSFMTVLKDSGDKIISIEDTPELMLSSKIWTRLISNRYIKPIELLQQCMRLSPDRMMIGEIRTGEVTLEFLKAMNSGHNGGITSIHANNAYSTILKLEQYLSEVLSGEYWRLISTAVDMIINVGINPVTHERPMVKEIAVLKGYDRKSGDYILEDAMTGKRIETFAIQ